MRAAATKNEAGRRPYTQCDYPPVVRTPSRILVNAALALKDAAAHSLAHTPTSPAAAVATTTARPLACPVHYSFGPIERNSYPHSVTFTEPHPLLQPTTPTTMAMTVLPSFQTFLQSAAQAPRPLSPLQPQSPVLAQPHFQFHFQAQASPQQQQQQSPSDGHRSPLAFPSTSDLQTAAIQDTHSFSPAVWKTGPLSGTSSGLASRSYTGAFSCSSEEDVDESDDEEHYHQDQRLLQRARARAESFVYRHRTTSPSNARRYVTPMATSFVVASPTSTSSASVDSSSSGAKRVKKKYLKERERCEIVRRVRAGEKQAHLAKEFGVSRAAVCYLLKHQMEILRRSAQRL